MRMQCKTYPLKKLSELCIFLFFLLAMAAFSFYRSAIGQSRSSTLFGAASPFIFWVLCGIALTYSLLFLYSVFQAKRVLTVSEKAITVHKLSLRGMKYIEIPFSSITHCEPFDIGKGHFLAIYHSNGKYMLSHDVFEKPSDFKEVSAALFALTPAKRFSQAKSYTLKNIYLTHYLLLSVIAFAAYSFYLSANGHESLSVFQLFNLIIGTDSSLVFWALFTLAMGGLVAGLIFFLLMLQTKQVVTLSEHSITVPKLTLHGVKHIEIQFSSIRDLKLLSHITGYALEIHNRDGKFNLAKNAFRSEAEFQEVHAALMARFNR